MPALACNCLGENFFADLMSLKDTPSIRALNSSNVFDELQETSTRLKVNSNIGEIVLFVVIFI